MNRLKKIDNMQCAELQDVIAGPKIRKKVSINLSSKMHHY